MKILFWGLGIFCFAWCTHLVVWRIHTPKGQIKTLLKLLFGLYLIFLLSVVLAPKFFSLAPTLRLPELLHISFLYFSLAVVYIITYSAIEVDSPSLVMVMTIAKEGKNGMEKEKFYQLLNDELLVKPRLKDLVKARLVYLDNNKYKLTKSGILFIRPLIFFRNKVLNAPKGG